MIVVGYRYYQNVRKEGDPPLPHPGDDDAEEGAQSPLRVVMYKGQRKSVLHIGGEIPKQEVLDFFKPVSQDLTRVKAPKAVPLVSNASFQKDVLADSQPGKPMVLLQMYEDTCFLCFLMRPFINSLGELLLENKAPFRLKRLNIEKNDFPDGCPVARGVAAELSARWHLALGASEALPHLPCFAVGMLLVRSGRMVEGQCGSCLELNALVVMPISHQEFKPKDLCEKITKVAMHLRDAFQKMDELQAMVPRRFQLFTQLVMWSVELQKLESPPQLNGHVTNRSRQHDSEFNSVLSRLMAKDMRRVDGLVDSIEFLQHQVDEV
ncbi:unnamed protein product [Symbiodinium natans]|uniref:Thioredoxin domain-containing protein n=1 Tax=Symbiodinium natans TaxID=878477 RepID=A0A812TSC2_9DINO|nr:unnamed protein product [Symbiodinium natans]